MKRIFALLLCVAMLLSSAAAIETTDISGPDAATNLHSLGLFQGIYADRFDAESMALDRPATRMEMLVMLLRLLGREDTAKSGSWAHEFTDVDDWANPYVGYAYQNGLSDGVGGGEFGSTRFVKLDEYSTLVLRALGYDDKQGDFTWNDSTLLGVQLGLYGKKPAFSRTKDLTRGDLVTIAYTALSLPLKGSLQTLGGSLVEAKVVETEAIAALNIPLQVRSDAELVLESVNQLRAKNGLDPLVLDEELSALAEIRAGEIIESFSHTRPDGRRCFTVMEDNGYTFSTAGENIADDFRSAEKVMDGWANSPGHYANMMSPNFGRLGVGRVNNAWVQLFAD